MVTMLPPTADDREIWSCSDERIAIVDHEGWIIGLSEGTCTVTVQSVNNPLVTADIKVTVNDPNKVNAILLSQTEMVIPIGSGDISLVTMLPENATNKEEVWVSSDPTIATVDEEGWICGVSEGSCIVTVYSVANPSVFASINVTVTDPKKVREIKLSKYEMNLLVGTNDISYVTMLPLTAENIEEVWTSSNPAIASVDRWGNVYGVSAGSCVVTVISISNPSVKADIKVTVHNPPPPHVTTTTTTTTTTLTTTTTTATTYTSTTSSTSSTTTTTTTTTSTTTTTEPVVPPTEHLIQTINGVTYVDGILIVNKTYSLPADYGVTEMNPIALESFQKLASDAALLGLKIECTSGYRSYEWQETIYNNYVASDGVLNADTYSARPGHSEHQTGLAIDVNSISNDFIGTPECEWLAQNAHRYGFIIRYPEGKEQYTGYQYEPWHIRYIGVDAATAVYNSGLCLEEYLGIDSYYRY